MTASLASRAPSGPKRFLGARVAAVLVAGLASLGPGVAEAHFRRPYQASLSFNYGFDHGGETDWNCGSRSYSGHTGTDFPLSIGTDVIAPANGVVTATNQGCSDYGYLGNTCGGRCGNYVQLRFDDGTTGLFCHMQNGSLTVSNGQTVACGDVLGRSASSGNSTGPHLHFAWRVSGTGYDPYAGPCSRSDSMWVQQNGYWDAPGATCESSCTPSAESCNGRDDDCDGAVDEGLAQGCGSDVGACSPGTQICSGGNWGACQGGVWPVAEACNGIDDDCDGGVDEELLRSCGTDVGACEPGTETCGGGSWGACQGGVWPVPETCNELDDDCDGGIDDDRICELEEIALQAEVFDGGGTTDVDGDGRADACAREGGEVRCYLASGRDFDTLVLGPRLADGDGWNDPAYASTLRFGDVDGDGRADACARAADGLSCWLSSGSHFGVRIVGPALSDAAGWRAVDRFSTIRLADVDGDGRADVCARDADGLVCWPSEGTRFGAALRVAALDDATGGSVVSRFGALRTGDVDGDGSDDLCARTAGGMRCWLRLGRATPIVAIGPDWSDAAGWDAFGWWSTIRLADVDGDGRADLCGRRSDGIVCVLSESVGFGGEILGPSLSDPEGWNTPARFLTLRMGDLDGDGAHDLCGLDADGVSCWLWAGAGFGARVPGPQLPDPPSWAEPGRYRTLRLADVDGDGRSDLCGRAADGLRCWRSSGHGFTTAMRGPAWSDALGWDDQRRYGSIRIGGSARRLAGEGEAYVGECGCRAAGGAAAAGWLAVAVLGLGAVIRRRAGGARRRRG